MSERAAERDESATERLSEADLLANPGDRPIASLDGDRLGRRAFAEALAGEILAAPVQGGYVMGLTGTWGSGKTSILNMTTEAIGDRAIAIEFNPWLFSGTEALVAAFFAEVAKQLGAKGRRLKAIAKKLSTYGRLLAPAAEVVGAGGVAEAIAGVLGHLGSSPSIQQQREDLRSALAALHRPLVVVLDDVDRLRPEEVLDVVRLVRLVGDFPNTLYLLAFDRHRVEECLGGTDLERGRAYLEKIVQVTHDVPMAREPDVTSLFLEGLEAIVDGATMAPLNVQDWQNIFAFVIRPLLRTPRQVRRYLLSLPMTLRLIGDEVAAADLLGIEAIRILRPEMFEAIVATADALAPSSLATTLSGYRAGNDAQTSPVAPLVVVDAHLAAAVCKWLFPAAQRYFENMNYGPEWVATWRRQRKLASPDVLRFYLERALPAGVVPARLVDAAIDALGDASELTNLLGQLDASELADLLERLTGAIDDLPFDASGPLDRDPSRISLPIILDLAPRLPKRRPGILELGPNMQVARVAYRLLKRITDAHQLIQVVREVSAETATLSGRLALVYLVGHRTNTGMKLVSTEEAKALEDALREDLVAMSAHVLAAETNAIQLAALMSETADGREALLHLAEDDRGLLSLLVASCSESSGQAMGAAAVTVTEVLDWDYVVSLLDEEFLVRRVGELMESAINGALQLSPEEHHAVELSSRYAGGWRPGGIIERLMRGAGANPTEAAVDVAGLDDDATLRPPRPHRANVTDLVVTESDPDVESSAP
jgi:hypothetical protein